MPEGFHISVTIPAFDKDASVADVVAALREKGAVSVSGLLAQAALCPSPTWRDHHVEQHPRRRYDPWRRDDAERHRADLERHHPCEPDEAGL